MSEPVCIVDTLPDGRVRYRTLEGDLVTGRQIGLFAVRDEPTHIPADYYCNACNEISFRAGERRFGIDCLVHGDRVDAFLSRATAALYAYELSRRGDADPAFDRWGCYLCHAEARGEELLSFRQWQDQVEKLVEFGIERGFGGPDLKVFEGQANHPICPHCGLSCGARACQPKRDNVCCHRCPELTRHTGIHIIEPKEGPVVPQPPKGTAYLFRDEAGELRVKDASGVREPTEYELGWVRSQFGGIQ